MACEAIVASLVGMAQFFGWRCRRPTCLQPCTKANNHGLPGTARCNKCGSGLAPRSAARAALDLKGAEVPKASASRSAARATLDLKGAEDPKASAARAALDFNGGKYLQACTPTFAIIAARFTVIRAFQWVFPQPPHLNRAAWAPP